VGSNPTLSAIVERFKMAKIIRWFGRGGVI
jgi:hypothetical protein